MEIVTPKVELYVTRSFSDKLSAAFSFIRENWRVLLKYFIYTMLPASLVLGFFVNHFWGGYISILDMTNNGLDDEVFIRFLLTTGVTIVVSVVVYGVFIAMFFALVRLYYQRPERLVGLTNEEFMPEFIVCLKRSAIFMLVMVLIGILFFLVAAALVALGVVVHPGFGFLMLLLIYATVIAVAIPLTLAEPIYMMEDDISVVETVKKSLRLGFATWGGIFAVSFVFGLLTSVIQTFTMVPWYFLFVIKMVFTSAKVEDFSFVNSFIYTFMEYLACVLQCLGYLLSAVVTTVGLLIQYGHASDKIDGVGVAENIEKFDEFDNF